MSYLKDALWKYPLVKTLSKNLPRFLVSIYSIATLFSFFPNSLLKSIYGNFDIKVADVDNSYGIKVIIEACDHFGLKGFIAPVNSFISRVEKGEELWVFFFLSVLVASSSSYYLHSLNSRINDNDLVRMASNPPDSTFVLTFSISALIDYVRMNRFYDSFYLFYSVPIILFAIFLIRGIIRFIKLIKECGNSPSDASKSSVPWYLAKFILLLLVCVFLSFVFAILFTPIVFIIILAGYVGVPKNI